MWKYSIGATDGSSEVMIHAVVENECVTFPPYIHSQLAITGACMPSRGGVVQYVLVLQIGGGHYERTVANPTDISSLLTLLGEMFMLSDNGIDPAHVVKSTHFAENSVWTLMTHGEICDFEETVGAQCCTQWLTTFHGYVLVEIPIMHYNRRHELRNQ